MNGVLALARSWGRSMVQDADSDTDAPRMQVQAKAASVAEARPFRWFRLGMGGLALVIVSALVFGMMGHGTRPVAASQLAMAPQADLLALAPTLNPAQSQGLEGAAQSCKVPLSTVQIWHDANAVDSTVQIKSGDYISPPIALSNIPKMIALPYPAPYPTGAGTLTVLGNAQGVELSLSPTVSFPDLSGAAPIAVTWNPASPCQ